MSFVEPAQINSFPSEILSSIFATIVDASLYARSIGDDGYGTFDYPTLISSVCARWRRDSIGISHLWTYIDFMLTLNDRLRNLEHVKLWLERSQNSPLHLRLEKGGERDEERLGSSLMSSYSSALHLGDELASILRFAASRVQSFTFELNSWDFSAQVFSALLPDKGEHPIRELALRQSRWMAMKRSRSLPKSARVRLLEHLHVLYLERDGILLSAMPCRKLVELQLINLSYDPSLLETAQLLESNPDLRTIVLVGFKLIDFPAPSEGSIALPSLRSARLSTDWEFAACFFKLLAPGPHELDLHLMCYGRPDDTSFGDTMISFFQRTRVKALFWQAEGVPLPALLASLPHLQRLGLSLVEFNADTLAGLEPATSLLPKLHTIDLDECRLDDESELDPGLRSLLSLSSVQRIRHLNCGHWDQENPALMEKFEELLEGAGFAAIVIRASASDFEHPSPFR